MEKLFDLPESTFKWIVIPLYILIPLVIWVFVSDHDKKIDEKRRRKK